MSRFLFISLSLAVFITLAALSAWAATGRHYYTKFEVVEQVEAAVDPDDPFADTGLYDDEFQTETVTRDEQIEIAYRLRGKDIAFSPKIL